MFVEELSALGETADDDNNDDHDHNDDAYSDRPFHPRSATYTQHIQNSVTEMPLSK